MKPPLKTAFALAVALLGGAVQASPEPAPTTTPPATQPSAPAAAAGSEPDAQAILQNMASQLAGASAFSVTIRSDYDAIQADGQRIAFGEQRRIQLQRPSQLRVDSKRSDGQQSQLFFDGKTITVFRPDDKLFARVDKPGTVDNAVVYMVQDLQMTLPLARMLLTTLPQELAAKTEAVSYVEQDVLLEQPTDHLAIRGTDVDLQLWVTRTAPVLPRRVVITYRNEPGQPQFRAELTDWNLTPSFKPEQFAWSPPAGVEQIPLLAPVRQPEPTPVANPAAAEGAGQ